MLGSPVESVASLELVAILPMTTSPGVRPPVRVQFEEPGVSCCAGLAGRGVMDRWLATAALLTIVGLLAGLLIVLLGIVQHGVVLRFEGPVVVQGDGGLQELRVELSITEPVRVDIEDHGPLELHATLGGGACPGCEEGRLLPVRWSLLSGEIRWMCLDCGAEVVLPR